MQGFPNGSMAIPSLAMERMGASVNGEAPPPPPPPPPPADYQEKTQAIETANQIGYFPFADLTGVSATDLSPLTESGFYLFPTLGEAGQQSKKCIKCEPADGDYVYALGSTRPAQFNPDLGVASCWVKVSNAAAWSDGTRRWIFNARNGIGRFVGFYKDSIANRIGMIYDRTGGQPTIFASVSPTTDWFHVSGTWQKIGSDCIFRLFLNGVQIAIGTFSTVTAWGGNPTSIDFGGHAAFGSETWAGWMQWGIVWKTMLTDPQLLSAGTI